MYYFGGDDTYGPTPYGQAKGIFMKIGQAESKDGLSWKRTGGVLLDKGAPTDFDALFVGWPQVVDMSGTGAKGEVGMYYHTFNVQTFGFEIGLATSSYSSSSSSDTKKWTKKGPLVLPRGAPGSHNDLGHATRCVIPDPVPGRKKLLMFAECANTQNSNCIAVYGSDDGMVWEDMNGGQPVFVGAGKGTGRWDAQALGCPSVIVREGKFYMYYVGFTESLSEGAALGCIGLAVSDGFDFTKWKRMGE